MNDSALESPRVDLSNAHSTMSVSFTVDDVGSEKWIPGEIVRFLRFWSTNLLFFTEKFLKDAHDH